MMRHAKFCGSWDISADANATRSDEEHNATLIAMIQIIADVMATDEAIELIEAGASARPPQAAVG